MTMDSTVTSQRISDPRTVALDVLSSVEKAWNDADGDAFGSNYAPEASFVTIRGEHIVGRAAIAAGHAGIFATIYAGSVNRIELTRATELSDGIVLAISVNTLDTPSGPLAGVHRAMSTSVIRTSGSGTGRPQILSTHNTLVTA